MGRGHHVGAEHGAPRGLPLHALQQSLLPQVAEQALKDVYLQFTQRRHQHLANTRGNLVKPQLRWCNKNMLCNSGCCKDCYLVLCDVDSRSGFFPHLVCREQRIRAGCISAETLNRRKATPCRAHFCSPVSLSHIPFVTSLTTCCPRHLSSSRFH